MRTLAIALSILIAVSCFGAPTNVSTGTVQSVMIPFMSANPEIGVIPQYLGADYGVFELRSITNLQAVVTNLLWGGITGTIQSQTDLTNYIEQAGGQYLLAEDGEGTNLTIFGRVNLATPTGATSNQVTGTGAAAIGGLDHAASGPYTVVIGGEDSTVTGSYATIIGADRADSYGEFAVVVGGSRGSADGELAVSIGGGDAHGLRSVAIGDEANVAAAATDGLALGASSLVQAPNGIAVGNAGVGAAATNSIAIGNGASAVHLGSFVVSDGQSGSLATTDTNQFVARFSGGYWFTDGDLNMGGYSLTNVNDIYMLGETLYMDGDPVLGYDGTNVLIYATIINTNAGGTYATLPEMTNYVVAATNATFNSATNRAYIDMTNYVIGEAFSTVSQVESTSNTLMVVIANSTSGIPETVIGATNGIPEDIIGATNGIPEDIIGGTNANYNTLTNLIALSTNANFTDATNQAFILSTNWVVSQSYVVDGAAFNAGLASNIPGNNVTGIVAEANIDSAIARDTEVTAEINAVRVTNEFEQVIIANPDYTEANLVVNGSFTNADDWILTGGASYIDSGTYSNTIRIAAGTLGTLTVSNAFTQTTGDTYVIGYDMIVLGGETVTNTINMGGYSQTDTYSTSVVSELIHVTHDTNQLSFTISAGTLYHTYIDNVTASLCTNGNLWAADLAYIGRALYVNGVEFGEATATPNLLEVTTVGNIAHTNGIVFPSSDETPDAPADGGTIFVSETNGIDLSSPRIRLADGTTLQLARDNYDVCRNTSGSTIPEYSTVTIIAAPGAAYSGIQIASRTNLIARPVYGLALTTVTNNGYCRVIVQGEMAGLDTSSWAEGAPLWQSDTDGVLTNVIPTSGTIQRVARCKISHASNGTIDVDPDNVLAPTAILESTVTNIAEWAAAQATNGLNEAIIGTTNGHWETIATYTNGEAARIAAATNGMLSVTTAWGGDAAGSTGTNITIAADSVLLNEIGNPDGDADINLSSRKFALRWTANTSDGIALELEASGATSNDILHIHQHTGNPPGLDLLHVEGDDADVVGIRIETANSTNIVGDGMAVFDKVLPTQLELPQSGTPDEDGEIVIDLSAAGAIVRFSSAHSLFSASTNVYPWTAIKSKTWSCSTPDLAYAETNRYPVMPIDDWQWPNGIAIVRAKLQTSEEVSCPAYILTMTNATDATPVTNLTLTLSSSAEVDADPAGGDGLVGTNNTIYVQPVTNDIAFMDLTIWYIIMGQ